MLITQTFMMANCCQKVRGNKTNQRPKQQQQKILKQINTKKEKREGEYYLTGFISQTF